MKMIPHHRKPSAIKQFTSAALLTAAISGIADASQQVNTGYNSHWNAMAYLRPAYPGYRHYLPGWRYSAPVISHTPPDNTLASASINDTAHSPASIQVTISGMQFVPSTIRIKTGDEVTWTNHEAILHAVTSPHDGSIASSSLGPGSKYSHTFNKPGIYIYYCALNRAMFGRVIVE